MSPDVVDQDHLTAYRPPGTSLVWAGLYAVFGHRYEAVRVLHCVVGAASVLLVYGVGRRCFGRATGLLSAGVYAVWPVAVFFSGQLNSEAIGTFWFLGFLLLCLRVGERPTWAASAGAGVLLGLTLLTRPNPLFMLPLTGVWAVWQFRRDRPGMARALAIPAFAVLTMAPWWVRNYRVFHTFIPLSTMGGSALLQGNNRIVATDPDLYGYSVWDTKIPEYRDALRSANNEVERDRIAKRFALEWMGANKEKLPGMAVRKIVRGWTPFLQARSPLHFRIGTLVSWGPVLVIFLIGVIPVLVGFLRAGHPGWILHLAILGSLVLTVILFGELRYRYSFEPICIVIAAGFAVRFIARTFSFGNAGASVSDAPARAQ
jgi:4-amino-4-deoxy-L-arabinose transferase-like glycosyltransferase